MNHDSKPTAIGRKAYGAPYAEVYFIKTEQAFLEISGQNNSVSNNDNELTEEEELF